MSYTNLSAQPVEAIMRLLTTKMRRSWTMTRYFGPGNFDGMIQRLKEDSEDIGVERIAESPEAGAESWDKLRPIVNREAMRSCFAQVSFLSFWAAIFESKKVASLILGLISPKCRVQQHPWIKALNAHFMGCDAFEEGDLLVTFPGCKVSLLVGWGLQTAAIMWWRHVFTLCYVAFTIQKRENLL